MTFLIGANQILPRCKEFSPGLAVPKLFAEQARGHWVWFPCCSIWRGRRSPPAGAPQSSKQL